MVNFLTCSSLRCIMVMSLRAIWWISSRSFNYVFKQFLKEMQDDFYNLNFEWGTHTLICSATKQSRSESLTSIISFTKERVRNIINPFKIKDNHVDIQTALPFLSVNMPDKTSRRLYIISLSKTSLLNNFKLSSTIGINWKME